MIIGIGNSTKGHKKKKGPTVSIWKERGWFNLPIIIF